MISQPIDFAIKKSTIEDNVGGKYSEESVSGFLEHWLFVKEIYDLSRRPHSGNDIRTKINHLMKEITLAVYPRGKFRAGEEDKLIETEFGNVFHSPESTDHIVGYRIPSLRAVITLMLMELITGHIKEQACDECGGGFVMKKPRRTGQNNFCSKKCGNKFRVNKHRNKQ